jgi:hypothetical protein
MQLGKSVQFGDQALDAIGLPGRSLKGLDDFEMAHLSNAFLMMATGQTVMMHNLLKGTSDNSFKWEKRMMLGNVRLVEELYTQLKHLTVTKTRSSNMLKGT